MSSSLSVVWATKATHQSDLSSHRSLHSETDVTGDDVPGKKRRSSTGMAGPPVVVVVLVLEKYPPDECVCVFVCVCCE